MLLSQILNAREKEELEALGLLQGFSENEQFVDRKDLYDSIRCRFCYSEANKYARTDTHFNHIYDYLIHMSVDGLKNYIRRRNSNEEETE